MKRFAIAAFFLCALFTTCYAQLAPRKVVTASDFKKLKEMLPQVRGIFHADSVAIRYLNLPEGNWDLGAKRLPDKYIIECNLYYKKEQTNIEARSRGQIFRKLLNKEGIDYLIDQMVVTIALPQKNVYYFIFYL